MSELPEASRRLTKSVPWLEDVIREFPTGTKTAADAAAAIGCHVSAIVKSLVFTLVSVDSEQPVVVLVPGDLQLDTDKLTRLTRVQSSRRATLDEVREATGYAAGGTPPFGHARQLQVFADLKLRRNNPVWAAAGTPTTVFPISLEDLDRLSTPTWADLTTG